jgi:hypothetical protein
MSDSVESLMAEIYFLTADSSEEPKGHQGLGSLLRYLLECKMYEEEK